MWSGGFLTVKNRLLSVRRIEQHIVAGVEIERRIEIEEIDALVRDVVAQNSEIVAIKERVAGRRFLHRADLGDDKGLLATRCHSSDGRPVPI